MGSPAAHGVSSRVAESRPRMGALGLHRVITASPPAAIKKEGQSLNSGPLCVPPSAARLRCRGTLPYVPLLFELNPSPGELRPQSFPDARKS